MSKTAGQIVYEAQKTEYMDIDPWDVLDDDDHEEWEGIAERALAMFDPCKHCRGERRIRCIQTDARGNSFWSNCPCGPCDGKGWVIRD